MLILHLCTALESWTLGKQAISCRYLTRCGRKMGRGQPLQGQNCQQSSFLSSGSIYNHLAGDEDEAQVLQSMYNVGSGLRKSSLWSMNWIVGWAWDERGEHPDKWNRLGERREGIFSFFFSKLLSMLTRKPIHISSAWPDFSNNKVNCGSNQTAGYSSGWSVT